MVICSKQRRRFEFTAARAVILNIVIILKPWYSCWKLVLTYPVYTDLELVLILLEKYLNLPKLKLDLKDVILCCMHFDI